MTFHALRILVAVCLVAVAFAAIAVARPAHKRELAKEYDEISGSRLDACVTCHVGATKELNPYGESLKVAGGDFAKVEKEDADGDGVINIDEIKLLSFPGDAREHAGAAGPDSTRKARSDSTAAKPDSTEGAESDSTSRKIEPEKPKDGGGSNGRPRFPWSPGFTG